MKESIRFYVIVIALIYTERRRNNVSFKVERCFFQSDFRKILQLDELKKSIDTGKKSNEAEKFSHQKTNLRHILYCKFKFSSSI